MNSFDKLRLPHVTFGEGTAKQAGAKIKAWGCKKCLVVTDKGVEEVGLVDPILETLKKEGIDYVIYDKTLPNPPDYICIEVAKILNEEKCDCTLAIGGGSSIDTAKAANLIANIPEEIEDLHDYSAMGTKMSPQFTKSVRFVCIPTTAGTGAEVTGSAVIHDTKRNLKYSFMNENQIADLVIIDPELTYGMPPKATATVGLDAMCHALEVVVGTMQHDFAAPLALDVVDRVRRWLPIVYKDPGNKEGRAQLAYAADMAESTGGAANGHAVAHAIASKYNLVHGHSCIMVMPTLIRHQANTAPEGIRKLADIFSVPNVGTNEEVAGYVADAVLEFYKSFGFATCKEAIRANGFDDDKKKFTETIIPAILDDFKSQVWMPPIHRPEDHDELVKVCEMIYDEE